MYPHPLWGHLSILSVLFDLTDLFLEEKGLLKSIVGGTESGNDASLFHARSYTRSRRVEHVSIEVDIRHGKLHVAVAAQALPEVGTVCCHRVLPIVFQMTIMHKTCTQPTAC